MIFLSSIQQTAEALMAKAAIEIPQDYLDGLRRAADTETGDLAAFVLQAMLENYEAAKQDRRAMCGDTGVPRWYVKCGNEARIEGGPVALEAALRRATANATNSVPLRPNRVHPLWRTDHDNNCGIGAPEIEYAFHPDADWIDLVTVHKGGLFGTDYRMLFPADGIAGIKRFYLDTLVQFGKRGLACQPAIVGVGLGGSKDSSMVLGKQAACLRTVGDRNPDPRIAALELEFIGLGNSIGMGAMGFIGLDGGGLPHRGRLLPHRRHADERPHVLPLFTPRLCAHPRQRQRRVPHRPDVVHRLHAARQRRMGAEGGSGASVRRGSKAGAAAPAGGSPMSDKRDTDALFRGRPALQKAHLELPATTADLRKLAIGTIVHLSGRIFTARERAYQHAIDDGAGMPAPKEALGTVNFHCSPAARIDSDGSYTVGAVTATASFRFKKWLGAWFSLSGCNIILGKGGMTSELYRAHFVPNNAIYLTTVGYGTGALLGRGIRRVANVYWREELGLAQAVWVLDVAQFGPFIVESDLDGASLFERENARIAPLLDKVYEGTRPATMRRFGEIDRGEDVI